MAKYINVSANVSSMSILKRGRIKELFHAAGIKRVSPNVILQIDDAVEKMVEQIAKSAVQAYPDQLLDGGLLQRLCIVHSGWKLSFGTVIDDDMTLDELVEAEQLPEFDDDSSSVEENSGG